MKLATLLLSTLLLFGCTQTVVESNSIVVSSNPVYEFVSAVVGSEVIRIMPENVDPHSFEPTPRDMARLEKAQIIFYYGHDLEPVVDRMIDSLPKEVTVIDLIKDIELLDHEHNDEAHEDKISDHETLANQDQAHDEANDPHLWMSPILVKQQIELIAKALIEFDPSNSDMYLANAKAFTEELNTLDIQFKEIFSGCNKNIFISHEILGYFCAEYGCRQHGIQGLAPEAEPTPRSVVELINEAREDNAQAIFVETTTPRNHIAYTVARELGIPIYALHSMETAQAQGYLELMKQNANMLRMGLCQ